MDSSAARYLEALTAEVAEVLGDRLLGVYPHGSLLLGGYREERSDVDVLVVVEDGLTPLEQDDLATRLSADALPCPAIGLELSVVTRAVAAAPDARPAFELHVTTAAQDRKVVDGHGHPGDPAPGTGRWSRPRSRGRPAPIRTRRWTRRRYGRSCGGFSARWRGAALRRERGPAPRRGRPRRGRAATR